MSKILPFSEFYSPIWLQIRSVLTNLFWLGLRSSEHVFPPHPHSNPSMPVCALSLSRAFFPSLLIFPNERSPPRALHTHPGGLRAPKPHLVTPRCLFLPTPSSAGARMGSASSHQSLQKLQETAITCEAAAWVGPGTFRSMSVTYSQVYPTILQVVLQSGASLHPAGRKKIKIFSLPKCLICPQTAGLLRKA